MKKALMFTAPALGLCSQVTKIPAPRSIGVDRPSCYPPSPLALTIAKRPPGDITRITNIVTSLPGDT